MIDVSVNTDITEIDLNVIFDDNIIDTTILNDSVNIDLNITPNDTIIDTVVTTQLNPIDLDLINNELVIDTTLEISNTVIDIIIEPISSGGNIPDGGLKRQILVKNTDSSGDYSWSYNFEDFLINVKYTGVESDISTGKVLEAVIDGNNVYRFISDTINSNGYPQEDSFYKDFNGVILNNLIKTRG